MIRFFTISSLFSLFFLPYSYGQGRICTGDSICVFTQQTRPSNGWHTNGIQLEDQFKKGAKKPSVCVVKAWTDGNYKNKIYKDLISYKTPIEIRKKDSDSLIVRFQYVNTSDDAAVETNNDVIFVDHEFTMYLIMPEHNCHGLPTSPTQYVTCGICKKVYKVQQFYNGFTEKYLNIYTGARNCINSKTGSCDSLILEDVKNCPKIEVCDQEMTGGRKNNDIGDLNKQ